MDDQSFRLGDHGRYVAQRVFLRDLSGALLRSKYLVYL